MTANSSWANVPGGGTNGAPVTITDGGTTVTMNNGIVAIVVTKSSADIYTINYTFNNTGSSQTLNLLSGGSGGYLYWFQNGGTFITGPFTESVVTNTGDYAEISLFSASATNGTVDIHFSMQRGSPGFYTTAIVNHRGSDGVMHIELRPNIYAGSIFNWMSVDAARNRLMEVSGGLSVAAPGAPKECYLWTNGIYAGQYEDKYKYSAMMGLERAWGWSSVGAGGKNVGIWNVSASAEYYPGGPMLRQLMEHIGTTILNVFTGGYYGLASDSGLQDGESWSHVYGPYFYYCNAVTNALTGTNAAAQALYNDALAQAAAEQTAWPYGWFNNTNYVSATNRGTVNGKIVISDGGNPNASAAGLWVGLSQQPVTSGGYYDFQQWMKPYQFWIQTDTNGNFSIPDVIAGTNYTLYAFGPGAAGTFMSQNQTGGAPPIICNLPASPFGVTVPANGTNNLGTVTWTPTRVGATVFEIGYPNRTANKFRHGDDYWVGDIGPSPTAPSPIWSKWLEYPFDFPNDVNYVVGQNRWTTDWNFCQPVVTDSQGNYNSSSSTITFNLATAPTNGATASLYLGLCSDYYAAIIVTVNGVNVASLSGLAGSPNGSVPSSGYYTAYGGSDTTIREGNNGAFTDERLMFSASALHAGANTVTIGFRQIAASYFANHFMYDYVRLELTGYVPPPPASVAAYAGNNCNLVSWPVTTGATSYNVLRSTVSGGGYVSITNGVTGPVCGSGTNNAVYLDSTAANNTTYYYVVRSVNPTGASTNSPQSSGVTPSAAIAATAPLAPAGLSVIGVGHQSVTLNWSPSAGANYYSVWRSTLMNNGGGASNTLSTIMLNNAVTNTSYTDNSPTDGSIYSYFVTATSAGGTGGNSSPVAVRALPPAPSFAPVSPVGSFTVSNITLNWTAVSGAVGYVISRATSANGPFTFLQSVTETTYTDYGLATNLTYYYRIVAVNVAGVSSNATNYVNGLQPAPAGLSAIGSNAQVILAWPVTTGATGYTLKRGTNGGNESTVVVTGYAGTSYTNAGLVNGTTYYYVVTATGAGGTSGNSSEASATADAAGNGTWIAAAGGNWSAGTNWSGNQIAFGSGYTADLSTVRLPADLTVTLDGNRIISGLKCGDVSAGHNWIITGTNTLTLGASPEINVVNQTANVGVVIAGSSGLTKTGLGTLMLGGATETFTNGAAVNAGTLNLDFSATNSPATNVIPSANDLTLGGGALQITGGTNGASSQAFASTTLDVGGSGVSAAPVSGTNNPTLTLAGVTENLGGTVAFVGPATINSSGNVAATATITTTTAGNGVFGAMGGWGTAGQNGAYATVGLYDFASTDTTAGGAGTPPYAIIGGSQVAGFYQTTGITTTSAFYDVNGGGNNTLGNAAGSPGIRFNSASALTITFSATTAQNVQGILVTPKCGAHNETMTGNGLEFYRSSSAGACYGVIWQNNTLGYLNFNSVIEAGRLLNGGSGTTCGLVQDGLGTVVYGGVNDYDLDTYLNGGYSAVTADSGFGRPSLGGTVNLNGGTVVGNATFTLDNGGTNARPVVLGTSGGGLAATAGNTMTVDGVVSGPGPLAVGILASGANGSVAGLLPGSGSGTANPTPVYATGTVTLSNDNTFTGDVNVNGGTLAVSLNNNYNNPSSGPLGDTSGARNINVNNGGTLKFTLGNALGSTLTTVGVTLVINGGAMVTNTANDIETLGPVQLNGGTLTGTGGASPAFQMYDLRGTVTVGGSSPSTISGPGNGTSGYHLAAPTIFNVADVTGDANSDLNVSGILVDQDGAGTIYGHLGAAGSLTKTGAGTLTLTGANTYGGGTVIGNGTLAVANTNGSATGTGTVTVQSGGTLTGAGAIGGSVTVTAGGSLAPGKPLGALTVSNNLTLVSGGTTFVQVQHSPLTNDVIRVFGTLTEGGLLSVSNGGAVAFTAGDSFKLFSAASFAGSFDSVSLPALNSGLTWSTTRLAVDGTLAVVSTNPPGIGSAGLSGTNLVWRGTGGTPNWYYTLLTATNLTQPLSQWTAVLTNQFDAGGNFSCTNAASPNASRQFYILKVQ